MEGFENSLSLENCLLELLLNSLSSEATAIAVRIDVHKRRIQVIDNGCGISKNTLKYLGEYREKNKNLGIVETRDVSMSGKSLIKIREFSSFLIIMSRRQNSTDTYGKFFREDEISEIRKIENRPACGTTVSLYGSRNFGDCNFKINTFAIRYTIAYLALVNTQVSFSVRDDTSQSIILRIGKNQKSRQLLSVICEHPLTDDQVHRTKTLILDKIKIEIFWGIDCTESRKIQQILLNLRPVNCPVMENFMLKIVKNINDERTKLSLKKIFFLFYIESPETEYKFSKKNDRLIVEFYEIDEILRSIGKFLTKSYSRDYVSSNQMNYKPIIPSLIFHPTRRILGIKQKRSFLTKVYRQSSKTRRGVSKSRISETTDSPAIDNDAVSMLERKSLKNIIPSKQDDYYDIYDVSQLSQKCLEESKKDPQKYLPISQNKNRDKNSSIKDCNSDNFDLSSISHKSIEKPQRNSAESLPISQSKNRDNNLSSKDCHSDNCDLSSSSHKSIEKRQRNPEESLPISQNKNQEETLSITKHNYDNCNMPLNSQKYIEKSQRDFNDCRPISQNINRDNRPLMKNQNYDNHDIIWISQKFIEISQKDSWMNELNGEKSTNGIQEMFPIDDYSQWSNWTYYTTEARNDEITHESNVPIIRKRFRFLPLHLHALLPRENVKLISRDPIDDNRVSRNANFNHRRRQDLDVRGCTRRNFEFRLKLQSLKSMKVLNQVNREFIVALTQQDDKKLLIIIDQHAMHERIRYENLLRAYKRDAKNQQFISVILHRPIVISDFSTRACSLLSKNRQLLLQYGLSLSHRNDNTLLIFAVPRCFLKKTFNSDNALLEIAVKKLLREVLEDLNNDGFKKILPYTIHEAIASEACHGSIKFGDPLTPEQCDILVSCWKDTDAPNRCAHGRPSVVPLLELSSYEKNHDNLTYKVKLNFRSLMKSPEYVEP